MTAAHCLVGRTVYDTRLVVGEHDRSTGEDSSFTAVYTLSRFIIHESYSSSTNANDIALVRTVNQIRLNFGVGLVCLFFIFGNSSFAGTVVTVTGWGTTEISGRLSSTLLKTDTNVITNEVCMRHFPLAVTNNFLCTLRGGHDTCQYDSGSSLYFQYNSRVYSLGVTSSGAGCGSATVPTLNMRVTQYLNWIWQNTPDSNYYCRF